MTVFNPKSRTHLADYAKIVFCVYEAICREEGNSMSDSTTIAERTNSDGSTTIITSANLNFDIVAEFKKSVSQSLEVGSLSDVRAIFSEVRRMAKEFDGKQKIRINELLTKRFGPDVPLI